LPDYKNIPIASCKNIPLALLAQCDGGVVGGYARRRRYTRAEQIEKLAVEKYKKNGKGITINDLLSTGLASNKKQSQITLKHCHNQGILFTILAHKPQQYYPVCIKSEILKAKVAKNIPIWVTGVGYCSSSNRAASHCSSSNNNSKSKIIDNDSATSSIQDMVANQSLEGYVLPLLPSAPLFIHKMQFKLKVVPECYNELNLTMGKGNNGKGHVEVIGKVRVCYRFYANGTVMVFTESSNNRFKLEDEVDRSRLIAFFGQVRDRLITFLMDRHERIVPELEWELTEFDVNKDIKVSDWFQYTGLKIQVKHLDHLFRVYIKSKGKDVVCRVEESVTCSKRSSAIETINNVFNANQHSSLKNTINSASPDNNTTFSTGAKI
jgi:hypothetical protein